MIIIMINYIYDQSQHNIYQKNWGTIKSPIGSSISWGTAGGKIRHENLYNSQKKSNNCKQRGEHRWHLKK